MGEEFDAEIFKFPGRDNPEDSSDSSFEDAECFHLEEVPINELIIEESIERHPSSRKSKEDISKELD